VVRWLAPPAARVFGTGARNERAFDAQVRMARAHQALMTKGVKIIAMSNLDDLIARRPAKFAPQQIAPNLISLITGPARSR
jgi:hypothetical protein